VNGVQIRVRVGAEQYALPVEYVHQVVDLGELAPVPGAADSVLGLGNLNGEIIPVFDLARILEIEGDGHRSKIGKPRLLITERCGQRAAFAVDEVIDVGPLAGAMQKSDRSKIGQRHLLASTVIDGTIVGVLAVDALFDSIDPKGER
jgi:purine-binding chemotaxis protein CheW